MAIDIEHGVAPLQSNALFAPVIQAAKGAFVFLGRRVFACGALTARMAIHPHRDVDFRRYTTLVAKDFRNGVGVITLPIWIIWFLGIPMQSSEGGVDLVVSVRRPDGTPLGTYSGQPFGVLWLVHHIQPRRHRRGDST